MTVLSFPGIKVSRIRRTLRTAVAGSTSPFTLREQVQDWGGEVWEYEFDVPPQTKRGGAALSAFFNQLGGKRGRFLFSDPAIANPAAAGSPVIDLSRRNLLTFTEAFENAIWSKQQVSVQANSATAPDGTMTATNVVPDTTNTGKQLARAPSVTSGLTYTFSYYAKANGYNFCGFIFASAGFGTNTVDVFDLANGTVAANQSGTASIVDVGDGWYRVSGTRTATASSGATFQIRIHNTGGSGNSFTGDGTSGILIWGAQLEAGPLSQYQPILGTTFTPPAAGTNMLSTVGWSGAGRFAGEFFSIGSGADTRLYQLTRDVEPSPSGQADIHFIPRLRRAPIQGAPVEVNTPQVLLRLSGPVPTSISTAQHYTFSIQAREAI